MLKKYIIKNFKSFKNETVIDLEKTNYQMLSSFNTVDKLLKGTMFVGPNASGKSNAILAIKFLLDNLFGKDDINFDNYICLFSNNPIMELNYEFEIDNSEIIYFIKYHSGEDYLSEILTVDNIKVFEREGSFASVSISEKSEHNDVPKGTLFLRSVYFNTKFKGNKVLQNWFEYLSNSVYIDLYDSSITPYKDINLSIIKYLDEKGTDEINSFFENFNFEQKVEYDKQSVGHRLSIKTQEKTIFFKRRGIDEPMPFGMESLGNQNLLRILPAFFHVFNNNGMLLLDEFSSGFHNDLEELLIKWFMKNSKKSQLIFVSHSTNLLTNSLLRPDQIYSVDFDNNGSRVKRFSSEKPREAQNLEKMYLSGIFSGVPKYEYSDK